MFFLTTSEIVGCSAAADGFDNIPEYILERLMENFSDNSDIDDSLFVKGDNVCMHRLVADIINKDCDYSVAILNYSLPW